MLQDGFESGSFSAWTSTSSTSGDDAKVVANDAYEGAYSAQFTSNGDGGYEKACAYENLASAADSVQVQGYFKLAQNGMSDSSDRVKLIELRAGSAIIAAAGLWQNGGNLYWWMETRDGSSYVETHVSQVSIDVSQWFSLELKWTGDASSGGGSLLVNGAQIYAISAANTADFGSCTQVNVGIVEAYNCAVTSVFADGVKLATSTSPSLPSSGSGSNPSGSNPSTTPSDNHYRHRRTDTVSYSGYTRLS